MEAMEHQEFPVFDGKNGYWWIICAGQFGDAIGTPEAQRLFEVEKGLSGQALRWYRLWKQRNPSATMFTFEVAFLHRYQPDFSPVLPRIIQNEVSDLELLVSRIEEDTKKERGVKEVVCTVLDGTSEAESHRKGKKAQSWPDTNDGAKRSTKAVKEHAERRQPTPKSVPQPPPLVELGKEETKEWVVHLSTDVEGQRRTEFGMSRSAFNNSGGRVIDGKPDREGRLSGFHDNSNGRTSGGENAVFDGGGVFSSRDPGGRVEVKGGEDVGSKDRIRGQEKAFESGSHILRKEEADIGHCDVCAPATAPTGMAFPIAASSFLHRTGGLGRTTTRAGPCAAAGGVCPAVSMAMDRDAWRKGGGAEATVAVKKREIRAQVGLQLGLPCILMG